MNDPLNSYETCVERLLKKLGKDHLYYSEALSFQTRLVENIQRARLFGDDNDKSAARMEILAHLSELTIKAFGISFKEFCEKASSNPISTEMAPSPQIQMPFILPSDFLVSAHQYITTVQHVAQQSYQLFCKKDDLWPTPCKRVSDSFRRINRPELDNNFWQAPYMNTTIGLVEVKLNYIGEQIRKLVSQLDSFCPICSQATIRVEKTRREICTRLQVLLEKDLEDVNMLLTKPFE